MQRDPPVCRRRRRGRAGRARSRRSRRGRRPARERRRCQLSPKCVARTPGGRMATAFVPPSRARAMAIPRPGVAATSARTSSAVRRGRSAASTTTASSDTTAWVAAARASFQGAPPSSKRGTPFAVTGSCETIVTGPTPPPRRRRARARAAPASSAARAAGSSTSARRLFASSRRLTGTSTWADTLRILTACCGLTTPGRSPRCRPRSSSRPRSACASEGKGRLVTYSPKVFIPLTKLCRDVCHYCTFAAPPRKGERAYMTEDEVLDVARAGAAAGCREALFTLGDKPELRYRAAREELAALLGCETTIEYLVRMCRLVLEETGLLPHANPGVMTRDELAALREVTASQGIMLETAADRLSERGGPHFGSPDKRPAVRLETLRLAGELAIPFTSGILIGIGETREERIEALLAIRELHERYGHIQEVIVQNFRAKPGTKMVDAPEPSLEELLWTAAAARLVLGPEMNIQAPPNLSYDDFPRLLEAGINDWGGVSPVTIDHVNPEAPWPEIERLAGGDAGGRARARRAPARLPRVRERRAGSIRRCCRTSFARPTRSGSRARARGRPAPTCRSRSFPRDALPVDTRDELGEEEIVRLFSRARRGAGPRLRRRRPAAPRGERRRRHVRRHAEHPVHERLLLQVRLLRVLEGEARGEPARACLPVPLDEIVRRVEEAWERGATEVCLQGGIHPSFDGDYYRVGRARDQGRRARHPRPRLLRARDLAGRGDARASARRVPRDAAGRGPLVAARDGRRGARRRDPARHLPRQGDDRPVARGARHGAPGRPDVEQHDHVRPRRRPGELGAPPPARARAAGGDGRLHGVRPAARSSTWRRRCT